MIIVPGSGPVPSDLMIVGEAPGRQEAQLGRPFCGPSGAELNWYLQRHSLSSSQFYLDNVVRLYQDGNPDPTPELIAEWTPRLLTTIAEVRPKVIVPVGRFATRWFLGDDAEMDACLGIPHHGGEFSNDITYRSRAHGAVVIPNFHPAYSLRNPAVKAQMNIAFGRIADAARLARGNRLDLIRFPHDPYAGHEEYSDVTGVEAARILRNRRPRRLGFDTEGYPDDPFSLQFATEPGVAYMLRYEQPDFADGVQALQEVADYGCVFCVHDAFTPSGTGYDTMISRICGLELRDASFSNTMYRAFALRIEPNGLKPLLWRWCGMRQSEYMNLIGDIGRSKQIRYLEEIAAQKNWPRIPPRVEQENNGNLKLKKFGKLESRAGLILTDIRKGKRNKDDELTDPKKRWYDIEPELRKLAEREMGRLPTGTLRDVPLDDAMQYGCADADGELRLDLALEEECHRMGVEGVCATGNEVLPIFEEMQHEGMPASRRSFVDLAVTVERDMRTLQAELSAVWFDGKPFNPAPNTKDVEALVKQLGITGLKKTKKAGRPSTSMKSLEYMAPKYPAIGLVGEWRRRQKVLNTYCLPLIQIADEQIEVQARRLGNSRQITLCPICSPGHPCIMHIGQVDVEPAPDPDDDRLQVGKDSSSTLASDLFLVHCKLKPNKETRRLGAEDPSLLNQPVRTEIGRKVRACYMTVLDDDPGDPNTEVFGEWDFSSQEVRVAAHISNDALLCAIMRDTSRKIHMETASRVFGKPIDQIDEIGEKIPAKTAFFGMLYGMSGPGLLDLFRSFGLENWPLDECQRLIDEIFRIYPGLKQAIRRAEAEAKRTGMVRDLYGHIRYLPQIWSGHKGEAAEAARQSFSHQVQGTAQGMTQCAMASLRRPIRDLRAVGVKWTLQIHDSILLRFPRWLFPVVDRLMQNAMCRKYGGPTNVTLNVPVLVDAHMSTLWSNLK